MFYKASEGIQKRCVKNRPKPALLFTDNLHLLKVVNLLQLNELNSRSAYTQIIQLNQSLNWINLWIKHSDEVCEKKLKRIICCSMPLTWSIDVYSEMYNVSTYTVFERWGSWSARSMVNIKSFWLCHMSLLKLETTCQVLPMSSQMMTLLIWVVFMVIWCIQGSLTTCSHILVWVWDSREQL